MQTEPSPALECDSRAGWSSSRRRFLAVSVSGAAVALAGCSAVIDYLADFVLEDVNLFNETEHQLTGEITVTAPTADLVLDSRFDLEPEDDEDDTDEESGATYSDVLTDAGEYTVTIALEDDSAVDGETDTEATVEVSDPDEEHIVVGFGADDRDEPIVVLVIESFTDLAETDDD